MQIVKSLSAHFIIHAIKSELDQMCNGLKTMGVLQMFQDNSLIMRPLLLSRKPTALTADRMIQMFFTKFSPQGSNSREREEEVTMKWIHYLQMIEGEI